MVGAKDLKSLRLKEKKNYLVVESGEQAPGRESVKAGKRKSRSRKKVKLNMETQALLVGFKDQLQAGGYAPSTIGAYMYFLDYFVEYLLEQGIDDLKKVTREVMGEYHALVQKLPVSEETKGQRLRPVKRLFGWLLDSHRLLIDPTEGLQETVRRGRKIPPVLTAEEMQKVLEQPNLSLRTQIRDRAIMETLYTSAIRLDELVHLTVHDVDLKDKVLYVRKGKGNRQRVTPLGQTAVRFIREYLENIRPRYAKKNRKERRLFLTNEGKPISGGTIRAFLRLYRIKSGINKPLSPHTFRRSCATHLMQQGADIRYVQKLLGHKRLRTTQQYTKVMPVDIKKTHEQTHPGKELC